MGLGYVPKEPFRVDGQNSVFQRREHRGTARHRGIDTAAASRARGEWGERMACRWYEQHGYTIVARNVRVGKGEIDFIASRDDVVVIGEVKARASENFGSPAEAMSQHKQHTVRRAGVAWAQENNIAVWQLRFDLVCIVGTRIEVLRNAF